MAEIADIITKLLERTNEDKVSWKPTANEDTFVAVVGNISTSVRGHGSSQRYQIVEFQILNAEGREIESYTARVGSDSVIADKVMELYEKARRVALDVDSQLDDLLKALDE